MTSTAILSHNNNNKQGISSKGKNTHNIVDLSRKEISINNSSGRLTNARGSEANRSLQATQQTVTT